MIHIVALALLAAATGVSAQVSAADYGYPTPVVDPAPSYTTIDVWESCTDTAAGTDTVTSTIVQTTCPLCTDMPPSTSNMGEMTHTTVYTTVYTSVCSTGYTPVTYTVTETCTGPTPSWSQGPSYMPQGFTTTVTVCTVCNDNNKPTSVTMTVPCDSTPAPGPASQTYHPPASSPPPSSASGPAPTPSGSSPAPSGGAAGNMGSGTTTTTTTCPGSTMCHHTTTTQQMATSTGSMTKYTGAAAPVATAATNLLVGVFAVGAALS